MNGYTGDPADKQAVFDYVLDFITKQGAPSAAGKTCRYRDFGGRCCAAGCLIPDDNYNPEMEANLLGSNHNNILNNYFRAGGYDTDFLRDLQRAHDQAASSGDFVTAFKTNMQFVAEVHQLKGQYNAETIILSSNGPGATLTKIDGA